MLQSNKLTWRTTCVWLLVAVLLAPVLVLTGCGQGKVDVAEGKDKSNGADGTSASKSTDGANGASTDASKSKTNGPDGSAPKRLPEVDGRTNGDGNSAVGKKRVVDPNVDDDPASNRDADRSAVKKDAKGDAKAAAAKKSRYAIPEGGPDEWVKFIERLAATQPNGTTPAEFNRDAELLRAAIVAASEKILAAADAAAAARFKATAMRLSVLRAEMSEKTPEEQMRRLPEFDRFVAELDRVLADKVDEDLRVAASHQKGEVLQLLSQLDAKRVESLRKFAAALAADKNSKNLAQMGRYLLVDSHANAVMEGQSTEAASVVAYIKLFADNAESAEDAAQAYQMASNMAPLLEFKGPADVAAELYQYIGKKFGSHEDKEVAASAKRNAEKAATRFGLVGKPLALDGQTVDGKKFDAKALAGKVVLVDFWATWCGPCIREIPNIRKNYERYHGRGFDVLSINLDDQRSAAEGFLKQTPLPWPVLYSGDAKAVGMDGDANAVKCGVAFLPTVMLIGKDGKVLTLAARGEDLGKHLEKLLGPADATSDGKSDGK